MAVKQLPWSQSESHLLSKCTPLGFIVSAPGRIFYDFDENMFFVVFFFPIHRCLINKPVRSRLLFPFPIPLNLVIVSGSSGGGCCITAVARWLLSGAVLFFIGQGGTCRNNG